MHFSKYTIVKGLGSAEALFVPENKLPEGMIISTPFTFPFIDRNRLILAKDKMGWWNPVGGHIGIDETWQEALKRETYEEAGVRINKIQLFGRVEVFQNVIAIPNYPKHSCLPFTWSKVVKIDKNWKPKETFERRVSSLSEARKLLREREDNHQMEEIFEYLLTNK